MGETTLDKIFVGKGENDVYLLSKYGNRHGLIAGATGTGKTVTLQILAEGFSKIGVPTFMADVKGDLAGLALPGGGNPKLEERATQIGLTNYAHESAPVVFWDLYGQQGHPIRSTISEIGPLMLSRMMDLNDVQEGVLNIAFRVADEQGLLLLDLKDLRAILAEISEHADELQREYGNVSPTSVGAIQRSLLVLEEQGAASFFGEPALDIRDFMRTGLDGRGIVNVLAADKLMQSPRLYATFLLWLLSELFEDLPEVGDLDKPKLVFFFDEAHLLFNDAPPSLIGKIEQVVRLVRSKGVGVFFVTQNPIDIPDTVLGQLGNRFQHALRAFTPRDQKAVDSAAETFRVNPKFKTEEAITQLGVGEALVSVLEDKGIPSIVDRTFIRPPASRLGAITPEERQQVIFSSPLRGRYDTPVDRDSADEKLKVKAEAAAEQQAKAEQAAAEEKQRAVEEKAAAKPAGRRSDSVLEALGKSVVRSAGSQVARTLMRGILGGLFKGR
jgi:DNA helicase HerA-like ATPase